MSLALDMIDAAFGADLTPNELKVFLILFRQTVCYGRKTDHLCIPQLVRLTGIRKDRLIPAIAAVLDKGLFQVRSSKEFQHRYEIPAEFLHPYPNGFYSPNVPQKRTDSRSTEGVSEKQNNTCITSTSITHTNNNTTKPTTPSDLPYPPSFSQRMLQTAARILDGLSATDARDCLLVLNRAMQNQQVYSPLGYLQHLARAIRSGTFDRSVLKSASSTPSAAAKPATPATSTTPAAATTSTGASTPKPTAEQQQRLRYLHAEIRGLDLLFQQAGTHMDDKSAAKRAAWLSEYNALLAQLTPQSAAAAINNS